jgi:pimeloyl-ACP methyl ester carboxylesterase
VSTMRLLCLHGYHGNADMLRRQMTPLFEGLEPAVELVHVDAPSIADGDFGWWHGDSPLRDGEYRNWAKTRDWAVRLFSRERFDGVFGFSQGAALTGVLAGLRTPDGHVSDRTPLAFDFAIMVGGFRSEAPAHRALYAATAGYALPSLHIAGRSDTVVPAEDSVALARRFVSPVVLEHSGGHVVPGTPAIRAGVSRFLRDQADQADQADHTTARTPTTGSHR